MTGPEHYAEAERLMSLTGLEADSGEAEVYTRIFAEAQVHATLALAAAVVSRDLNNEDWQEVTLS